MKKYILGLFIFLSPVTAAKAASLYFSPAQGEVNIGDIFTVDVKINLDDSDECINTIEAAIGFDNNYLAAEDFSTGDSFLSLWLEKPGAGDMPEINSQKRLKFIGGTPGGYCGKIPGDDGDSNVVGKIIFRVINSGFDGSAPTRTKLFFYPGTQALLNDGFGTQANLSFKEAEFGVSKLKGGKRQEWDRLKTADNIPPEPFTLEILKNSDIYEGKYYLVWNTLDKQTGIDHYEIQESLDFEGKSKDNSFWSTIKYAIVLKGAETPWIAVSQPYILQDQLLKSVIRVKAFDKAGNSQIAEYFPAETGRQPLNLIGKIGAVVILLAVGSYLIVRRKKQNRN